MNYDTEKIARDLEAITLFPHDPSEVAKRCGYVDSTAFRITMWKAMQDVRERTGRQMKRRKNMIVMLTASELSRYASTTAGTAVRKLKRARDRFNDTPVHELLPVEQASHQRRAENTFLRVGMLELRSARKLTEAIDPTVVAADQAAKRLVESAKTRGRVK